MKLLPNVRQVLYVLLLMACISIANCSGNKPVQTANDSNRARDTIKMANIVKAQATRQVSFVDPLVLTAETGFKFSFANEIVTAEPGTESLNGALSGYLEKCDDDLKKLSGSIKIVYKDDRQKAFSSDLNNVIKDAQGVVIKYISDLPEKGSLKIKYPI